MSIAGGQTIAAAATGMTEAGIGIIRISGEEAVAIGNRLFADGKMRRDRLKSFQAGTIHFGYILDPFNDDEVVDEVMVSVMLSPHSYTTEDTVEINSHGGMFVMNRILQIVLASGARLAEPGEFTKRAFLGGRIDLARAEAVMDLISSQNEFARKTSVAQLGGGVGEGRVIAAQYACGACQGPQIDHGVFHAAQGVALQVGLKGYQALPVGLAEVLAHAVVVGAEEYGVGLAPVEQRVDTPAEAAERTVAYGLAVVGAAHVYADRGAGKQ